MCDGLVIKRFLGGDICIPIYYEAVEFPPHPNPGPLRELLDDFTVLATINQLTTSLANEEIGRQITRSVQSAAAEAAKQLPEGVSLGDSAFGSKART